MLQAIGCITEGHDPGPVALAFVVCLLALQAGLRQIATPAERDSGRLPLPAAGLLLGAAGIWLSAAMVQAACLPVTDAPLVVTMAGAGLLMALLPACAPALLRPGRQRLTVGYATTLWLGGLIAVHATLLAPLRLGAPTPHALPLLLLTLVPATGLSLAGFRLCLGGNAPSAAALLAASVVTLQFGIGGAIATAAPDTAPLPDTWLTATPVTATSLLAAWLWAGAIVLERRRGGRSDKESRRLALLANECFEGLIFEFGGVITDTNIAMQQLAGRDRQELIGTPLSSIVEGMALHSTPGLPAEHTLLLPDGKRRPVEVLWRNGQHPGSHVVAVRDLTREKSALAELQHLASFDRLTGLPNRDQFERLLSQCIAGPEAMPGFALLYIDIDQFEAIYETFGARASDETLLHIARRLETDARNLATVARLGRDEFAIILPLPGQADAARQFANQALDDLRRPIEVDNLVISITASAGVALFPDHGKTAEHLIQNAAFALRRAKREGRSRWHMFEPEFGRRQHERQTLEKDLAVALAEGQLAVHYQSFYNSETLEVAGCEALLRWTHPLRGKISPAEFIPIAESNGMIVPIGKWVLATACADAARWAHPAIVAVNVSPAQFAQASLAQDVAQVLAETGLPPERLELEITETVLMADTGNALRLMKELKTLGVRIAMDDFGTGHSSLGNLRKFPFDKIKIDRSFISDGDDDAEAETIVDTIIAMGKGLGLAITAEGVETNRQLAMLRSHGCTYVQGYLLARPCPVSQLRFGDNRLGWLQTPAAAAPLRTPRRLPAPV